MSAFHFDLRHIPDAESLRVDVHGTAYGLRGHDTHSLRAARETHPTLAALPLSAHASFTHFAEIDDRHFAEDEIRWVRVVREAPQGVHLPEVVLMAQVLPAAHLRAYYRKKLVHSARPMAELRSFYRARLNVRPLLLSPKLYALGLKALPKDHEQAVELLVGAQSLVNTLDTAGALVAHHPDLANVQPYTATVVMHEHILPDPEMDPDQFNAMKALAQAIGDPDQQPWSPVIRCKDQDGKPLDAGYDLGKEFKAGQPLYTYGLSDGALQAASAASGHARRSAVDDVQLQSQIWTPSRGTTALVQPSAPEAVAALAAGPSFKWTVDERTDHHGVSVNAGSIRLDGSSKFSIDASNSYLRTLYVGYQLLDEAGQPLGDKQLLYSISASNTILGIPVPTDPTGLEFDLKQAAAVQLYFGSLGTSEWDGDVSPRGALLTGLWQYGIPIVFLIAGKAITSTKLFNKIVNDKELVAIAVALGLPIVGAGVATSAALLNTKKVLFSFADVVLSLVLQKGMEKLGEWLVAQVAAGQLSAAFGPVGWVLRLAAVGMNVEAMAVTTGEVLSSPACIKVKVSRAIDVKLTLQPDPRHGEAGNPKTAVWPAVATRYAVTLQYRNGTSRRAEGELSKTTSSDPIAITFADVPAGGQFRVIAGFYSANGWLAGSWQNDWTDAVAPSGTTLDLGPHTIKENLVPLAPDAQYVFKERVGYEGGKFAWQTGDPPTTTRASLDCGGSRTLCELVGITLNNSGFQVGYAWRASGQQLSIDSPSAPPSDAQTYSVQNLSVLADPDSRLISTSVGFSDRPAIAYAPSTNSPKEIDPTNFFIDPRGGGMHLRRVPLDGSKDFGIGTTQPSWGRFPLENVDAMAIHPSNSVIACSWRQHKLMILPLPDKPSPDQDAPLALLVSGEGLRQGLMQGPQSLAVAPDGRILVLETLNRRVQAFDLKGNPVPSFTPGPPVTRLATTSIAAALDKQEVPEALQAALLAAGVNYMFGLDAGLATHLDGGRLQPENDPLISALSQQGVLLSYDAERMDDPKVSAQLSVVARGSTWRITDPRGAAWQVVLQDGALAVYHRMSDVEVRVEQGGQRWLLLDRVSGDAWRLAPSPAAAGQTEIRVCLSFFPLRAPRIGSATYLDMATEAQGYVYVLFFTNDGSKPGDYMLDIYGPDGAFVMRTPDPSVTTTPQNVVAGKIAVDIWRNLYALGFEVLRNGRGATQPGLAHWMPTPPLFSLDLKLQPDFNQLNIGIVSAAFAEHRIGLSNRAFITVEDENGAWSVKDGDQIFHVYRSGDGLQVYVVPA